MIIPENKKEFEICNIFQWWDKGYTGKGIKIAELESFNPTAYFLKGKIKDHFNIASTSQGAVHGTQVLDVMHQVAPDAQLYALPFGYTYENGKTTGKFIDKTLPFIVTEQIHIVGASFGGADFDDLNKAIEEVKVKGTSFITSAGNKGKKGLGKFARTKTWLSVGALGYDDRLQNIYLKNYSSRGKELDVVGFSGLYIHPFTEKGNQPFSVEGTSFSSPFNIGMCALVQQFFLEKTGRTLYQWELENFIYDHCVDLGEVGFDEEYGHGLFILPHPDNIDIKKYVSEYIRDENMEIKMTIGSNKYYVDGIEKNMDTAPFINEDNRTLVPVRFIAEALDCKVEWDNNTRTVIITKE